jgi:hypothetical protein
MRGRGRAFKLGLVLGLLFVGAALLFPQVKTFPAAETLGSSGPLPNEGLSSLLNGLVSYYPLSDTTDVKGGNNLTNNNSVTFVSGLLGNAASFGATSNLTAAYSAPFDIGASGTGMSVTYWMKVSAPPTGGSVMVSENTTSNPSYLIQFFQSTSKFFSAARDGATLSVTSNQTVVDNTWHFVAHTFNPSDKIFRVYIDGNTAASSSAGPGAALISNNAGLAIGGTASGMYGRATVALMDEVGLWNVCLTPAQVTCVWNNGTPVPYPFTGVCIQ